MRFIIKGLILIIMLFGGDIYSQITFSIDSISINRNISKDKDLEIHRNTPVIGFYCSIINNSDKTIEFDFKEKQLNYYFEHEGRVYLSDVFIIELLKMEEYKLTPNSTFNFEFHTAIFEKEKFLLSNFSTLESYYEFLLEILPSFKFRYINDNFFIESGNIKKIKFKGM